jgi:hypothetical protein
MSDIFLSYAREDLLRAQKIAASLEALGFSVFWDRRILPGETFDEVIAQALKEAHCVVVLWSLDSVNSHWVKDEAVEGQNRQVLVPVLIDAVLPPLGFRHLQAANLVNWQADPQDQEFQQVIASIKRLVEIGIQDRKIDQGEREAQGENEPQKFSPASKGLIWRWFADWLGYANVNLQRDGRFSPHIVLLLVLGLLALLFATAILKNFLAVSQQTVIIIRLFLLVVLIFLCNFVVVAKKKSPLAPNSASLTYKYGELERLTSKIVLPLSLVVLVILMGLEPKACFLSVDIRRQVQTGPRQTIPAYLDITGDGESTQFPVADSGVSEIHVSAKQKKQWTLSVVLPDGTKLAAKEFTGCPHDQQEFILDNRTILVVRPR